MAELDGSNPINAVALSDAAHGLGWAATGEGFGGAPGLYKTTERGATWSVANAGLANTHPTVLLVDPSDPAVVHTNVRRVSRTTTGGASWSSTSTGITAQTVVDMDRDPAVPSMLWLTNHYQGVHRSTDNGSTWTRLPALTDPYVNLVRVAPGSPRTVYVTALDRVYRSTDDGATFPEATTFPRGYISAWAIARSDSRVMVISISWPDAVRGVHVTTDGGASWAKLLTTSADAVAIDPTNAAVFYALTGTTLQRSTTAGASWTSHSLGAPSGGSFTSLAIAPSATAVLYVGTAGGQVLRSADAGATWAVAERGLPPLRTTRLAVSPADPDTLYVATQGRGIYKTTTGGL
jgi:photosystem II stability/assembly factor-like uncharacterized protein